MSALLALQLLLSARSAAQGGQPEVVALTLNPTQVVGGATVTATVTSGTITATVGTQQLTAKLAVQ